MVEQHMALVEDIQVAGRECIAEGEVLVLVVPVARRCWARYNPAAAEGPDLARSAALEVGLDSRPDCSNTGSDQTCFGL